METVALLAALRMEMTCNICHGLFTDPHLFSGCGHTFCYTCIIGKIEGKGISTSQCPTCNQPGWKRDLKPVHVLANIAQPISHLLDAVGQPISDDAQPSAKGSEGRRQGSAAVSKQEGSGAAKPKAAKQTGTRKRFSAGPKRVTFADCQDEQAGAEQISRSKSPVDTTAKQRRSRATRTKCVSTAAEASQLPQKPSLVPDTYAESDGSQQDQAGGVQASGKRLKRPRAAKASEDRRFIKQFAAEAHALLGGASPSQHTAGDSRPKGNASDSSLQERSTSPEASKTEQGHSGSQSSALPLEAEAQEPVLADSSAKQAVASTGGSAAAREDLPSLSPKHITAPAGAQSEADAIPETPGATRRLARSSSPAPSLAEQDQDRAAGCPGQVDMQSIAGNSAEREPSRLLPGQEEVEAPSTAVVTHTEERTLSMQTPEPSPADALFLGQGSGQGGGQLAGQAAALSVQEVHALGTELCSKAARYLPAKPEDAEALRSAVRSMRAILEAYACQAAELGTARPIPEPSQDRLGRSQGCYSSPRRADASQMHFEGTLPGSACAFGATESLSAIDAALMARGVRLQSLATLS